EIGLIKKMAEHGREAAAAHGKESLATVLDYLPANTIFLLCDPSLLEEHAAAYAQQIPEDDAFFFDWASFRRDIALRKMTLFELFESDTIERPDGNRDDPTASSSNPSRIECA